MIQSHLFRRILFSIFFFLSLQMEAQEPEQDCSGAIVVTSSPDTFSMYTDTGLVDEIFYPQNTSCLVGGEENSVWITFTACDTGLLLFQILPSVSVDDFDWVLYDFTNHTCSDVVDLTYELRCNYSANPGPTGVDTPYTGTSSGAGGVNQCAPVHPSPYQRFLLVVNNHASTLSGFILTFGGNVSLCLPVSFAEENTNRRFLLYPTPTNGTLQLKNLPARNNLEIEVMNVYGNKVYRRRINTLDGNQLHLPSLLPEGFYVLRILEHGKPLAKESFILSR